MQKENQEVLFQHLKYDGHPTIPLNAHQLATKAHIDKKIGGNEYQFEKVTTCPICLSKDFSILAEKDRYGFYHPTCICKNCGLMYASPRFDQKSFIKFYKEDYRDLYMGEKSAYEDFFKIQIAKGEKIYKFLKASGNIKNESLHVLEVGCGSGGILKYFQTKGFTVKGIDFGVEYINYGVKQGLDLEFGSLKDVKLDKKPDIIIYSHVFEHILDPNDELNEINKVLKSDGILYIEVPGVKNIHKTYSDLITYLQNAHVFHYTLTSLTNLFSKHGFKLRKGSEKVRAIFKKSETNNAEIVNEFSDIIQYLTSVEKMKSFHRIMRNGRRTLYKIKNLLFS